MLAPSADCFGIATPYEGEGHYSTYLCLFGRDLRAGESAVARVRLRVDDVPQAFGENRPDFPRAVEPRLGWDE